MATGDEYDFDFSVPKATDTDLMIIAPGRALLGINELNCSTKCTYLPAGILDTASGTTTQIVVRQGASSLITGVLGAFTAAALLAF